MTATSLTGSSLNRRAPMPTASGKDMRRSGDSDSQGWVIDPQYWVEQWRRMYPVKPAHAVAAEIGAPARTVEKWFSGDAKPSLDYVGPILNRYGLAFVVGAMAAPLPWLDDLARADDRARLQAERRAIDELIARDDRRGPR